MLKDSVPTLCYDCHGGDQARFTSSKAHSPVKNGDCLACHEQHSSPNKGLLKIKRNQLCYNCHTAEKAKFTSETAHKPVADGDCFKCHDAHGTDNNFMLTKSENQLCFSCHSLTAPNFQQAHRNFPMENAACAKCHDPHSTPKTSTALLYPSQHQPFKMKTCDACHVSNTLATKKTGKELCLQCHPNAQSMISKRNIHKALTMTGECVNCHSPHDGFGKSIMSRPNGQVCYDCHDKAKFTKKFVHKPAAENCSTCHEVHSSDNARLLTADDEIKLCLKCHDADKTHNHPMGKDFKDPRTGERLVCSSCHSPHSSDYENILIADKQRGLCILCHAL
jgi:predicted CXXCH cytochrome family protein